MVNLSKARKGIERLYDGLCEVQELVATKDPVTGIKTTNWATVLANQPCRVSFKTVSSVGDGVAATTSQTIKLFISPDIEIKAGSRIKVTQNKLISYYKQSGVSAMHSNHQEIILEVDKKWA